MKDLYSITKSLREEILINILFHKLNHIYFRINRQFQTMLLKNREIKSIKERGMIYISSKY